MVIREHNRVVKVEAVVVRKRILLKISLFHVRTYLTQTQVAEVVVMEHPVVQLFSTRGSS